MVCENAIKMDHESSSAFCIDCFNTKISSQMKPSQCVWRPKQQHICITYTSYLLSDPALPLTIVSTYGRRGEQKRE